MAHCALSDSDLKASQRMATWKPVRSPRNKSQGASLSATTSGTMDLSKFKHLAEEIPQDSPCRCRRGDIDLQRGNTKELVGTAAIFDAPDEHRIFPDLMHPGLSDESKIQRHFLLLMLQSFPVREFIIINAVWCPLAACLKSIRVSSNIPHPCRRWRCRRRSWRRSRAIKGHRRSPRRPRQLPPHPIHPDWPMVALGEGLR